MEASLESKPHVSFAFEVEKIIGISSDGNYQVQWKPLWVNKFCLVGCEHLIQEFMQQQSQVEENDELMIQILHPRTLREAPQQPSEREMEPEPECIYKLSEDITTEMERSQCERTEEILEPEVRFLLSSELSTNCLEVGVQSLKEDTQKSQVNSFSADTEANNCLRFVSLMEDYMNSPALMKEDDEDFLLNFAIPLQVEGEPSITDKRSLSILATEFDGPEESNFHRISEPFSSGVVVNDEGRSMEMKNRTSKVVKQLPVSHHLVETSSKNTTKDELDEPDSGGHTSASLQSKTLSKHRRNRHSFTKCEKQFPKPSDLSRHTRGHRGEKRYKCSYCDKSFAQRSTLKQHMNTHTGAKPYSCPQCSFTCSNSGSLSVHKRTHTGEKPFACEHCSYSSGVKSHLTRHLRTHTGEKSYVCNYCTYSSVDRAHLNRHLLTHTGEKPYSCGVCWRTFRRVEHRNRHVRRSHRHSKIS